MAHCSYINMSPVGQRDILGWEYQWTYHCARILCVCIKDMNFTQEMLQQIENFMEHTSRWSTWKHGDWLDGRGGKFATGGNLIISCAPLNHNLWSSEDHTSDVVLVRSKCKNECGVKCWCCYSGRSKLTTILEGQERRMVDSRARAERAAIKNRDMT